MNLTKTVVIVLMSLLVGNTVIANDGNKENVAVIVQDNMKFVLQANQLEDGSVVKIVDSKNRVLFSDYVGKENTYEKKFNLSYLGDGEYKFVVVSGEQEIIKSFEIATKRTVSAIL